MLLAFSFQLMHEMRAAKISWLHQSPGLPWRSKIRQSNRRSAGSNLANGLGYPGAYKSASPLQPFLMMLFCPLLEGKPEFAGLPV